MMSKIFDVRWYQALLSADEPLSDKVLEGLYKSKLKDSVQLQSVLALYDPETVRNKKQTSYSRLKNTSEIVFLTRRWEVGTLKPETLWFME